jgi:hypothetical protein
LALGKKLFILGAFGCRLVYVYASTYTICEARSHHLTRDRLIPVVVVRLFYLSPSENSEPTVTSIIPNIITEAALELCLISACITSLKPFLQPVHSGYMVTSVNAPGSSFRSGKRAKSQDSYYMLSTVKESDKDGTLVSPNEFGRAKAAKSVGDDGKLRGHVSIAIAPGGREEIKTKTPRISSGRQSLESDERPMVITRTRMFTVAEAKV